MKTEPNNTTLKVGGDFYNGMEYLAAWLLDNVEGEIVTEELAREWAIKAWREAPSRLK